MDAAALESNVCPAVDGERQHNAARGSTRLLLAAAVALLAIIMWLALDLGRDPQGWHFCGPMSCASVFSGAGRATAALAAGAMLAAAGNLLQRFTSNAMASPEVFGMSSGLCWGHHVALPRPACGRGYGTHRAAPGAFGVLLIVLLLDRRSAFSPDRMLLAGVAISSAVSAIVGLLMASSDPRMANLLFWMSGSTYRVIGQQAIISGAIAIVMFSIFPLLRRWLEILPLGEAASRTLGVDLAGSRLALLLAASALTAAASLIVGPLSFVGLMTPHMARMMGMQRPMSQLFAAVVLGGLVMVSADWLGHIILFPYQVPAGLLAALHRRPLLYVAYAETDGCGVIVAATHAVWRVTARRPAQSRKSPRAATIAILEVSYCFATRPPRHVHRALPSKPRGPRKRQRQQFQCRLIYPGHADGSRKAVTRSASMIAMFPSTSFRADRKAARVRLPPVCPMAS